MTDVCGGLAQAIAQEATRISSKAGGDPVQIAASLALSGWRPADIITREARDIVANFYKTVKNDAATAAYVKLGHRDGTAEVRQAKAAMARAFEIAAEFVRGTSARMANDLVRHVALSDTS